MIWCFWICLFKKQKIIAAWKPVRIMITCLTVIQQILKGTTRESPMGITVGSDTGMTLKCFNIWWCNPTQGWHHSAGGPGWHLSPAPGGPDVPLWWKRDVSAQNTSVTETAHTREDRSQRWDATVLFQNPEGEFKQEGFLKTPNTISQGLEGRILTSLINLRRRILDSRRQNQKGKINNAGFIARSPSIKVRPYQSPPALLKCSALTGE